MPDDYSYSPDADTADRTDSSRPSFSQIQSYPEVFARNGAPASSGVSTSRRNPGSHLIWLEDQPEDSRTAAATPASDATFRDGGNFGAILDSGMDVGYDGDAYAQPTTTPGSRAMRDTPPAPATPLDQPRVVTNRRAASQDAPPAPATPGDQPRVVTNGRTASQETAATGRNTAAADPTAVKDIASSAPNMGPNVVTNGRPVPSGTNTPATPASDSPASPAWGEMSDATVGTTMMETRDGRRGILAATSSSRIALQDPATGHVTTANIGDVRRMAKPKFTPDVMAHVQAVGTHLPAYLDEVGRRAALNYVAEEADAYHEKGAGGKLIHKLYDLGAATGVSKIPLMVRQNPADPNDAIPSAMFPESWLTSKNLVTRGLANLDPLTHDTGPANIKLRTAGEITGTSTLKGLGQVGKSITTDAGTAHVAARLVQQAQNDLQPFIRDRDTATQAQIITDYLRSGAEHFWDQSGSFKNLTPEQTRQWHANPDTFAAPDGSRPVLQPNHPLEADRHHQIKEVEMATRPADW